MLPYRILFVCLGNICRSPLAEGILHHKLSALDLTRSFGVDSAGTSGWHNGDLPDSRSIAVARQFGIDLTSQRSRAVQSDDFHRFDLILGMDEKNVTKLHQMKPETTTADIALFLDYAQGQKEPVPDPYYGGEDGFEAVYHQLDCAMDQLIQRLTTR